MGVTRFELGSKVRVVGYFKTPKTATPPSEYLDPDVIVFTIRSPDLTVETRTYDPEDDGSGIIKIDVGRYAASIDLAQEGTYKWRWSASKDDDQAGVKSGSFDSTSESDF